MKTMKNKRASENMYNQFREYFSFPCVDLVIFKRKRVLLTKREINPYKGFWHLPGTIIRRNEKIEHAVKRAAKSELNVNVKIKNYVGCFESINKFRHDISLGFIVSIQNDSKIKTDFQSTDIEFYEKLPKKIPLHHKQIIVKARKYFK